MVVIVVRIRLEVILCCAVWLFCQMATAANPPTTTSPGYGSSPGVLVNSLTPTFSWNAAPGATGYGLYIRDMTATGTPLIYPNANGVTTIPLTGTSLVLPKKLTSGHIYRWNMTSFSGSTEGSAVSSVLYFQTPADVATVAVIPPVATPQSAVIANPPTILSPGGAASAPTAVSSLTPEFRWNYVTGATGYGLYIRDMTAAGTPLIYPNASGSPSPVTVLDIGFGPSFTIPAGYLVKGHTYRWNMTSFTGSTESSGVSSVLYFQTPPAVTNPPTTASPNSGTSAVTVTILPPTTISPGDPKSPGVTINSLAPVFSWNAASGATGYGLYIRDMTAAGTPLVYPNANGTTYPPLTGTSLTLPANFLVNGHNYRWNMTSFNGSTENSAVSAVLYFKTPAAANTPTITSTNSGSSAGTVASTQPIINTPNTITPPAITSPASVSPPGTTAPSPQPQAGQPDFSSIYYTTANHFWRQGDSPASTSPPNPPGCQLGNALGNCTWYAYGRMLELGYNSQQLAVIAPPGQGDASKWANNARKNNILVDGNPIVGAIAQSDSQDHVAVVESLNGNMITVSESAYIGNNPSPTSTWNFLWRRRTVSSTWFNNYIHVSKSLMANVTASSRSIDGTVPSIAKFPSTSPQVSASAAAPNQPPSSLVPQSVTVKSVPAPKTQVALFTLTAQARPNHGGTVSGVGNFAAGSSQTLNATPNEGFVFENWSEHGRIISLSASYNLTMDGHHRLEARFKPKQMNRPFEQERPEHRRLPDAENRNNPRSNTPPTNSWHGTNQFHF